MLDIGGLELLLIAVVALLVIGPERLPETLRTLGLWLGRLRRSFTSVKAEIEKEIGMDEVKRQLHNEAVMAEMKRIEEEVQNSVDDAKIDPNLVAGKSAGHAEIDQSDGALDSKGDRDSESDDDDHSEPDAIESSDPMDSEEPEEPVLPRTEAQVEAAYERKVQAQQAAAKDAN